MDIKRNGSQPSQRGPAEHFTGTVRIDPLFQSSPPGRVGAAYVTFEPCARSDWHTHPLGQTLVVTFGCGRHQRWGGPIEELRPGDVVTVGPNQKHWHGASPTTAMTHMAPPDRQETIKLIRAAVDGGVTLFDNQSTSSTNTASIHRRCRLEHPDRGRGIPRRWRSARASESPPLSSRSEKLHMVQQGIQGDRK